MTGPGPAAAPEPLRSVYAGQDAWIMKYPSIRPARAKITTVTAEITVALIYDGHGVPDHDRKQYMKFPAPDALSACLAFRNQADAVKAWNAVVYRAIAEATDAYKTHVSMLEKRILPEPEGKGGGQHE